MPRPLFGPQQQGGIQQGARLTSGPTSRRAASATGRLLTTPRTTRYLAAIARLDASATLLPIQLDEIIDDLHKEFAETWSAVPLGFVAHCYLGPPFEAHTLTIDGAIIEHYRSGEALPGQLEQARALTRTEHYSVIEVYPDKVVCVRADGSVVALGG